MPHPLDGIRAKIERADEHIQNLNAEITAFLADNVYDTVTEHDHETREAVIKAIGPDLPLRFAVIAGEAIHQLRSSLDHLVTQLVLANGRTPGRSHQFPICDTADEFVRARDRGYIKGISTSAAAIIKSLQPAEKHSDFKSHPLWIVQSINNADKHRLLVVVLASVNVQTIKIGSDAGPLDIIGISPPAVGAKPTDHGAEILRIQFGEQYQPDVYVKGEPIISVAFEEFGPLQHQPVIERLQELRDKVAGTINLFGGEFA